MFTRRTVLQAAAATSLAPFAAQAQASNPFNLVFRDGRYLQAYAAAGGAQRGQIAALVGDEATALADAAEADSDLRLADEARAEDAIARIVREAAGRRVVVLNEAHTASRHRAFLGQVLRALRPTGFTHFAAEAFVNVQDSHPGDVRLYRPGAPLGPSSGIYLCDPVFAEAVREAAELGYRLVPYEQRPDQQPAPGTSPQARMEVREEAQADNLIAGALSDPGARVLVYVGWGHLRETPDARGNAWLALRLKRKTGIDPLTVAQATAGAFGPHAPDSRLTRQVLQRFRPHKPIVVDQGGEALAAARSGADLAVFHPDLPDVDGRPGWLAADPGRRRVVVTLPRQAREGLRLVQALHRADPELAVPADHYLHPQPSRRAVFFLRPGAYRLRVETQTGFVDGGPFVVRA